MPAVRSRRAGDEATVKPRSDAYVGLLGLSLLALSAAMLFAFLNWQGISEKPKPVQMAPVGGGAAPRTMPGPGGPMNAPQQAPPGPGGVQAPPPGPNQPPPGGPQPQPK